MATYISIETDKKISYQIDGGDKQTMFANIDDDGYPEPTGTITITENGTGIDVKDYAAADVEVPTYPEPTGTITITENAFDIDVKDYAAADVLVEGGGYPEPTGTITITQNGTGIDVKDYAAADVAVPSYPEPTGTITITQNGTGINVKDYAAADVAVPSYPEPTGTKQISITQNGTTTENVKDYASAEITVNVPAEQYYIKTGSFTIDSDIAVTASGNDITVGFTGQPDMIYCWMSAATYDDLETPSSNKWYRWYLIKNDGLISLFPPVRISGTVDVQGHYTSDIDYITVCDLTVNTSSDPTNSKGYALNPPTYSTSNSSVAAINNDGTITIARASSAGQTVLAGTYNYIAYYGLSYLPV